MDMEFEDSGGHQSPDSTKKRKNFLLADHRV